MSGEKLFFYSKSKDVYPGKGVNEYIINTEDFKELSEIPHWRRILSNFHVFPFKYEEYTYNSIEHAFQAKKIALVDAEKAMYFTIESKNPIGLGDGALAQKNRKLIKLNPQQLEEWNKIKYKVMYESSVEKYKACKLAQDVLKRTKNTELWHIVSRSKPTRFTHLERIRQNLK